MKTVDNQAYVVSDYNAGGLQEALSKFSKLGYSLVSTQMAKNKHNVTVMFLFFTKVSE